MQPKLIVEQKITAFVNKYMIFSATPDGKKAQLLALAQQKRLKFKEKVIFYTDESKTNAIFTFRAEKVFDVHGRYLVETMDGTPIGSFKKQFKQSLLKSTWHVLDTNDKSTLTVTESSQTLAIIRRFAGFIPLIGDLVEIVVLFFRYHFSVIDLQTSNEVGRYQKTTLFRDHYQLTMVNDSYQSHDWRVLSSLMVALDALQSR